MSIVFIANKQMILLNQYKLPLIELSLFFHEFLKENSLMFFLKGKHVLC